MAEADESDGSFLKLSPTIAVVTTIEGLTPPGGLSPLQEAFRECHALQCGFCTPGMLLTVEAFLRDQPAPTEREIREAIAGNLCRCTGYQNIVTAIQLAARRLAGEPDPPDPDPA